MREDNVDKLMEMLMNEEDSLFNRYRAMFTLRNMRTPQSIQGLCKGLSASSALFRHEIAFVLGQIADPVSIESLIATLKMTEEHSMVRHECAEALGAIATPECLKVLEQYRKDNERVVRESCDIALDMCEYGNSDQFQYADGLGKVDSWWWIGWDVGSAIYHRVLMIIQSPLSAISKELYMDTWVKMLVVGNKD